MIQKNGGCEHMVCARCKYEFCWFCLGPYFRYQHLNKTLACPYRYVAVVGVMFALFFVFFAKLGYAYELVGKMVFPLYYYVLTGFLIDA